MSSRIHRWFGGFAANVAYYAGSSYAFISCLVSTLLWLVVGPFVGYSDTWQLWANTVSTIVTTFMVFLIQNAQNRESQATQIKLDELLHAIKGADNRLISIEEMDEEQLSALHERYRRIACCYKDLDKDASSTS
jgi:low affinity Fe/Cu permease